MSWYEKERPTPFDSAPIVGLYFVDGKSVERLSSPQEIADKKLPCIVFPSGEVCSIEGDEDDLQVELDVNLPLPYKAAPSDIVNQIRTKESNHDYAARLFPGNAVAFRSSLGWGVKASYDPDDNHMVDVERFEWLLDNPAYDYIPDSIREKLPKLYSQEEKGLDAEAVVKYFTPDTGWTWYASEFDGDNIFFGLVAGFEVELGYFALSELMEARGPLNLPIERDLHYEPRSLRELRDYHNKQRYG